MKCVRCTREAAPDSRYCQPCRDGQARRGARWYAKNAEYLRAQRRDLRRGQRLDALHHYGGVCKCCGEPRSIFLTIDHVDGNGAEHRRELASKGGPRFVDWLRRSGWPEGYQVLCWNCNLARAIAGSCPHQMEEVA